MDTSAATCGSTPSSSNPSAAPSSKPRLPVHVHPSLDSSLLDRPLLSSRVPNYTSQYLHHPAWHDMDQPGHFPRLRPTRTLLEGISMVLMLAVSVASLLIAYLSPHWMIDDVIGYLSSFASSLTGRTKGKEFQQGVGEAGRGKDEPPVARMGMWLGVWSARRYSCETLYLRRLLLLESLAWGNGFAAGYLHNLKAIANNQKDGYVLSTMLVAEFNSHRTHAATLQSLTQPGPITRAILLVTQAVALPLYFCMCCVKPAICHHFAAELAALAVVLYTQALKHMAQNNMPRLAATKAPLLTQNYYGRKGGSMADAFRNIRADDWFHLHFNSVVACHGCHYPVPHLINYMADQDEDTGRGPGE